MSEAETFYAIDFDRCLSDTYKLDTVFYEVVDEHKDVDGDKLRSERRHIEDSGGSFDEVQALQKQIGTSALLDFFDTFIERAREKDMLSDGARELIDALEARDKPFGIVSYGGPEWQRIKMQASGVENIPTLITNHKKKGAIIKSWQQQDNRFLVPADLTTTDEPITVDTVVLMDDKATAFSELPPGARGYWIQSPSHPLLLSQVGSVPPTVQIAKGLREVISLESL